MYYLKQFYPFVLFLFFFSCGGDTPEEIDYEKCKYGKPQAIFSPDIKGISSHVFKIDQYVGTENLILDNQVGLEIIQSGCDDLTQDFNFKLKGKIEGNQTAAFWVDKAVEQFFYLANLSPEFMAMGQYANALVLKKDEFRLGEAMELAKGMFFKIDKINVLDDTMLMVSVSTKN